ncbi:MAG: SpoIIIAH-like family protein [Clostridiales bacterium]|nr:SpoIIIAH-like family protein [Clostridiales bacterium]
MERKNEMKSKIFKRNAIILTVIAFVCVAVYLNWSYAGDSNDSAVSDDTVLSGKDEGIAEESSELYFNSADQTSREEELTVSSAISDYFATARLTRGQARDSAVTVLRETMETESISPQASEQALAEISALAEYTVAEAEIETLIKAKGFADCVVFLDEDSAIVAVPAPQEGLSSVSVSRITDIILSETGLSTTQIKIIEVK